MELVNAVNAALHDCEKVSSEAKLSDSKITKATKEKPAWFKVNETVSIKYRGEVTPPRLFDAWNSAILKAEKVASFESVAIPAVLIDWVMKFRKEQPSQPVHAEPLHQEDFANSPE